MLSSINAQALKAQALNAFTVIQMESANSSSYNYGLREANAHVYHLVLILLCYLQLYK